jgi:hypothetical protein
MKRNYPSIFYVLVLFISLHACKAEPASREAMLEAKSIIQDLATVLEQTSLRLSSAADVPAVITILEDYVVHLTDYTAKGMALQESYPGFNMNSVQLSQDQARQLMVASYSNVMESVLFNPSYAKDVDPVNNSDVVLVAFNEFGGETLQVSNYQYAHAAFELHSAAAVLRSAVTNLTAELKLIEDKYADDENFATELERIKAAIQSVGN